ncbi:MAG: superoxide dismutase [Leptolinea sp.]|nr:superoxide dismutase [Leptolinea sp.]
MPYKQTTLKYGLDAFEPHIDAKTMEVHYTKHHATYLNNLNAAVEKHPELFETPLGILLSDLDKVPEVIRTAVRNNGGGVFNHNFYFDAMKPGGGTPKGKLAEAINKSFGSFETFKQDMEKAGLGRFGSGFAWLSQKKDGSLVITSTPNQDTPMTEGLKPLLTVDVWEHAYYLKYQNRRADYLSAFWNVIDWDVVEKRFHGS